MQKMGSRSRRRSPSRVFSKVCAARAEAQAAHKSRRHQDLRPTQNDVPHLRFCPPISSKIGASSVSSRACSDRIHSMDCPIPASAAGMPPRAQFAAKSPTTFIHPIAFPDSPTPEKHLRGHFRQPLVRSFARSPLKWPGT